MLTRKEDEEEDKGKVKFYKNILKDKNHSRKKESANDKGEEDEKKGN